ncbi:hypothetical protein L1887_63112 [Cichorium endivia]|nr:hypothetical protein L1887_63112 [Cichorium endivia]
MQDCSRHSGRIQRSIEQVPDRADGGGVELDGCVVGYASVCSGLARCTTLPPLLAFTSTTAVEAWLFSRAQYTTSLSRHWTSLQNAECVWKGYRVLYRTPTNQDSEHVQLPASIAHWTIEAMQRCNDVLPAELRNALPGWSTAFLARPT